MANQVNDLLEFFENNKGKSIHKWMHYFDIYDRHFSRFREQDITVLEIGVDQGGSLAMWQEYFGNQAKIYGMDNNPLCKKHETDTIKIFIGDQANEFTLKHIVRLIGKIDILIDDGGHMPRQQIKTFETLYQYIKPNGVYLCEDTHTSYWPKVFGGGYKKSDTYIEYAKNFVDYINAWHIKELEVSEFTMSTDSVHFYDSIVVLEKRPRTKPFARRTPE